MILKKKAIVLTALMLCVCVIALFTGNNYKTATVSGSNENRPQIILDAGHAELPNTID